MSNPTGVPSTIDLTPIWSLGMTVFANEKFSGKDGSEAEEFVMMVRKVIRSNGWYNETKAVAMIVGACFEKEALRWHSALDNEIKGDWARLETAILNRWPSSTNQEDHLARIIPAAPSATQGPVWGSQYISNQPARMLAARTKAGGSLVFGQWQSEKSDRFGAVGLRSAVPPRSLGKQGDTLPSASDQPYYEEGELEIVRLEAQVLLHKLTLKSFDQTFYEIMILVNSSANKTAGATLIQVVESVFEVAAIDATRSQIYARLCCEMMEQISKDVKDEEIRDEFGRSVAGRQLFKTYLLNRCQESFEKAGPANEDDDNVLRKEDLPSSWDRHHDVIGPRRQGLGLVRFIGELFKLGMVTERIMHECINSLLNKADEPEEEAIEKVCELFVMVGQALENSEAENHMDRYFGRMSTIAQNPLVADRLWNMIIDVIHLRGRRWRDTYDYDDMHIVPSKIST